MSSSSPRSFGEIWLAMTDAPGVDDRAERRRADVGGAVDHDVDPPEPRERGVDRGADLLAVAEVGREHEDVVALGPHRREASEHVPVVLAPVGGVDLLEPLLRVGNADRPTSTSRASSDE